jgi:hypothetical protein
MVRYDGNRVAPGRRNTRKLEGRQSRAEDRDLERPTHTRPYIRLVTRVTVCDAANPRIAGSVKAREAPDARHDFAVDP